MAKANINRGKVLIAEPFMIDPNFKRSVVLLCEHEQEGSLGFILNKSLDMQINELIADFPEFDSNVYYGGPVQTDTIHYIHNVGDMLDNSHLIQDGVYWGGDFEKLKLLIDTKMVKSENIKFFVGYTGWSPEQLVEEMKYGSWVISDMDDDYIFGKGNNALWNTVMRKKGDTYSVIAQMPDSITWN